jgi:HemY protein
LAEIGVSRPVIEVSPPPAAPAADVSPEARAPETKAETKAEAKTEAKADAPPEIPPRKVAKAKAASKPRPIEPVIPLVHIPDDPGLDADLESDPVAETTTVQASEGWRRLRKLFR